MNQRFGVGISEKETVLSQRSSSYPSAFPISLSHNEYPTSREVMEQSGTPFGVTVQPFIEDESYKYNALKLARLKDPIVEAHHIARCNTCSAYINPLCDITGARWFCALCMNRNSFSYRGNARYR